MGSSIGCGSFVIPLITDKLVLRSYSTKIMPKKRALALFDWRISYRKCVLKNPKKFNSAVIMLLMNHQIMILLGKIKFWRHCKPVLIVIE